MEILSIIETILFVVLPVIFIGLSILWGFKRNLFQALAKFAMTLLAVWLSVLIVRLSMSSILQQVIHSVTESNLDIPVAILQGSSLGSGLMEIVSALIRPVAFHIVFAVISLLFLILYIIPKRLLSDNKLEELKLKKQAIDIEETIIAEPVCEGSDASETKEGKEPGEVVNKQNKFWLRIGSVSLSVLSTLLVLSHLAQPICYYSQLVIDISSSESIRSSMEEIEPYVEGVSNHPTIVCYRLIDAPATYSLDYISAPGNSGGTARSALIAIVNIVDQFEEMSKSEPTAEGLYSLADLLEENPVLDNMIIDLIREMVDAWESGADWFGVEKPDVSDDTITKTLFEYLKECSSVSSALRLAGDALTFQGIMESGEITPENINAVLITTSSDGIIALGKLISAAITASDDIPEDISDHLYSFVCGIFNGIAEIKQDATLSDSERITALQKEANAITIFYSLIENPSNADPKDIGRCITESVVFSNVISDVTDNGNTKDPCGFGQMLSEEYINSVEAGLEQGGVDASSELHKSVMSFFGK